jgi:hypothetical protein
MKGGMNVRTVFLSNPNQKWRPRVMRIICAQELQEIGIAIFKAAWATTENAEGVTSSLISANLAGHDSQ